MKLNTITVVSMLIIAAGSFGLGYYVRSTNFVENDPIPNATENIDCDSELYKRLLSEYDYEEQVKWLKANSEFVCNANFYQCIEDLHNICDDSFEKFAQKHIENKPVIVYYDLKKGDLKGVIDAQHFSNCYEKHVTFDLIKSTNPTVPNRVVAKFEAYSTGKSCYSIPLFLGIFDKYSHSTNLTFRFCKAIVGTNKNATIFQVIGDHNVILGSYDISDDPKKK